jgi:hypothetical protein
MTIPISNFVATTLRAGEDEAIRTQARRRERVTEFGGPVRIQGRRCVLPRIDLRYAFMAATVTMLCVVALIGGAN